VRAVREVVRENRGFALAAQRTQGAVRKAHILTHSTNQSAEAGARQAKGIGSCQSLGPYLEGRYELDDPRIEQLGVVVDP
jgi:hypothetical protein